ncbi:MULTISPECIES: transposase [unclassified Paenibacillus]|uniref:transposase n=1 Tax=unclassified Paenibacillus TaxID=185978 RepID=UPI0027815A6D|nr:MULTISPECIES: transposase [unclassified Paenibacillus]MDQ0901578.1 putative membrane protein [Paenibacillus sp. V4I7]MDQ0919921.1 putative membrane protein [Paenibacillus sp. V4I5]
MSIIIVVLSILIPISMLISAWLFTMCRIIYHMLAVGCAYVFGIISVLAIYEILRDETVFMTNIHGIFQNVLFLLSGAFLGCYGIYTLLRWTLKELRSE